MDIFVIGDENTVLGFSLVGIEGEIITSKQQARERLEKALNREGLQILLITENWAAKMREKIDRVKMEKVEPLVLEIPGPQEAEKGRTLHELVESAIGFKLSGPTEG